MDRVSTPRRDAGCSDQAEPDVDLDDIITIDATTATIEGRNAAGEAVEYSGSPIEGVSATFEEYREGIKLDDGRSLVWSGNRRSRELRVFDRQWIGFSTNLTLKNYKDVITGKNITYKDAEGRTITRTGNNLGGAFLNSLAVAIPGTIIPILIAAFAAFGFAWLEFPAVISYLQLSLLYLLCRCRLPWFQSLKTM